MYFSRYNDDTHKLYENILSYSIISEFFIGIALFFWNGLLGVAGRFFESFVYVVLLISAYLLVKSDYKIKSIIRFILLCAVITTVVSVQYQPDELKWELTDEEFIGITFAGSHIPNTSYIFSDFRLGPPLIYFNQLGIVTIDSSNNLPTVTEELLDRCYYNVSNPEIILDKIIDSNEYYVMTSFHQTEVFLLDSSLKRFKVVPTDFQKQWTSQKYFNKVYSSWYFNLYQKT